MPRGPAAPRYLIDAEPWCVRCIRARIADDAAERAEDQPRRLAQSLPLTVRELEEVVVGSDDDVIEVLLDESVPCAFSLDENCERSWPVYLLNSGALCSRCLRRTVRAIRREADVQGIDIDSAIDEARWEDERLVDLSDTLGVHVGSRELDADELGPDEVAWDEHFDLRRERRRS